MLFNCSYSVFSQVLNHASTTPDRLALGMLASHLDGSGIIAEVLTAELKRPER
jgi:hypothetical protein